MFSVGGNQAGDHVESIGPKAAQELVEGDDGVSIPMGFPITAQSVCDSIINCKSTIVFCLAEVNNCLLSRVLCTVRLVCV